MLFTLFYALYELMIAAFFTVLKRQCFFVVAIAFMQSKVLQTELVISA